jgi:hypothetical protein
VDSSNDLVHHHHQTYHGSGRYPHSQKSDETEEKRQGRPNKPQGPLLASSGAIQGRSTNEEAQHLRRETDEGNAAAAEPSMRT